MSNTERSMAESLSAEDFRKFREWIHHHSGIFLEDQRSDPLRISLVARATRLGMESFDEYYEVLTTSEDEFRELLNLITINETSFFRFPAQFEAFESRIVPEILEHKRSSQRTLRVWSAGCSTGEEPYSVAIALARSHMADGVVPEVLGTDVSTEALLKAKSGVYAERNLGNVPEDVLHEYFDALPHGHRVSEGIRGLVDFHYHNLVKEPYPLSLLGNWDVIFCRNVTIYFSAESTKRVVGNFYESLNPGGYLFVGHSETLASISDQFEPVEVGGVFLYRKPRMKSIFPVGTVVHKHDADDPRGLRARIERAREKRARDREAAEARPLSELHAVEMEPVALAPDALAAESVYDLVSEGAPGAAISLAQRLVEADPASAQNLLALAFAQVEVGELDLAAEAARRSLAIDPLLASARYILGVVYQRQGDQTRAVEEFKRTLYIDQNYVLAHFNLANVYRARGAKQDARREYDNTLKALSANPDGAWMHFLGGFNSQLLADTCRRNLDEREKAVRSG